MGSSPRLVPSIVPHPTDTPSDSDGDTSKAQQVLDRVRLDAQEVRDKSMLAKVFQADRGRAREDEFKIGEKSQASGTQHCINENFKQYKGFGPQVSMGPANPGLASARSRSLTLQLTQ